MDERLRPSIFVFDSGRLLKESPEGQLLGELLTDFSEQVLAELDQSKLVLIAGESGLGKTELFLKKLEGITTGGIVDLLIEAKRSFMVIDAQLYGFLPDPFEEIMAEQEEMPEILIIDESGALENEFGGLNFQTIKKLLENGMKIILVSGGIEGATRQNDFVSKNLRVIGVDVAQSQMFEYPSQVLNKQQCKEILLSRESNLSSEIIDQLLEELDRQDIPRIFRVIFNMSIELGKNTRQSLDYFLSHIKWNDNLIMRDDKNSHQQELTRLFDGGLSESLYIKIYRKFLYLDCMQSDTALRQFIKEKCPNLDFIIFRLPNANTTEDRASRFLALLVEKKDRNHRSALEVFVGYLLEQKLLQMVELI